MLVGLMIACSIGACGDRQQPPFEIRDLRAFAPLPGSNTSVAYLTIVNNTERELRFTGIESPDFARTELHESVLENGVMRMRALNGLTVSAHASVVLREGGKHIMLLDPHDALQLEQTVTLVLKASGGAETVLRTSLKSRIAIESSARVNERNPLPW